MRVRIRHQRLADAVYRSNLTQNHLAMRIGLSSGHLADLVNGKTPYPAPQTREKLIQGLDLDFEELFEIEPADATAQTGMDLKARFQSALSDRYVIDDVIGQGGMGTVYLARDVKHGRQVAIKVVLPDVIEMMGTRQFLKEIRSTATLQHPNILPLHDSGEAAECPYFVSPYVKAGSLRSLLEQRGPLGTDEALGYARGICSAVQEAHDSGMVHCDIKPENILLSGGQAIVADFGIARVIHIDGLTRHGEIDTSSGTPAYISPEQASGDAGLDSRSDQYSIACVLYEMLAGRPPFAGSNDMAVIAQRFLSEPPDLRDQAPLIPFAVAATLKRAMAPDPKRRYASVADFLGAFEQAVRTGAVSWSERFDAALVRIQNIGDSLGRRFQSAGGSPHTTKARPMGNIVHDVHFALRWIRKKPLIPTAAIISLGLGIGANSLVFSFVNAYLLRPLPFDQPGELVAIATQTREGSSRVSVADFDDWRSLNESFVDVAAYNYTAENVRLSDYPRRMSAARVSSNAFDLLGVRPMIGTAFQTGDDRPGGSKTVVLKERLWREAYGGSSDAIGQSIEVDGVAYEITGVMSDEVIFPLPTTQFWMPHTLDPTEARDSRHLEVFGRLRDGVSVEQARADLERIAAALAADHPETNAETTVALEDLWNQLNFAEEILIPMGAVLLAAVFLVLILAAANVANLFLSQGTVRNRELALRVAVGASRGRVVSQLVTESLVVAFFAGALGLALAALGARLAGGVIPADLYRVGEVSVDGTVVLFTLAATLACALVFGLIPALKSTNLDLVDGLKEGAGGGGGRKGKYLQSNFVALQVAGATALLVATALVGRSLSHVRSIDLGFDYSDVTAFSVQPPRDRYAEPEQVVAFQTTITDEIEALPGVTAAGIVNFLPLNHEYSGVAVASVPNSAREERLEGIDFVVDDGYFAALDIPIVAGRSFQRSDGLDAPKVVVIDRSLARQLDPELDVVGSTIYLDDETEPYTIVGVAGTTIQMDLLTSNMIGAESNEFSTVFRPQSQSPWRYMRILVETDSQVEGLAQSVRAIVNRVDPLLPTWPRTLDHVVRESMLPQEMAAKVMLIVGLGALILAVLGVYSLTTFFVSQRLQEIAVRRSLGATVERVKFMIVGRMTKLAVVGVGIGSLLAFGLSKLLESFLLGVGAFDPLSFGAAAALLIGTVLASGYLAVRQVSRVQPIDALRAN